MYARVVVHVHTISFCMWLKLYYNLMVHSLVFNELFVKFRAIDKIYAIKTTGFMASLLHYFPAKSTIMSTVMHDSHKHTLITWSYNTTITPSIYTIDEHTQHQHHLHTILRLPLVVVFTPDCSSMGGYVTSLSNLDLRHLGRLHIQ